MPAYFEPGSYKCQVVAQGFDKSSQKQTPFFWMAFQVIESASGDMNQPTYERDVRLYLHENTIDGTIERLRGLGWDGASWSDLEPGGAHSFVGQMIDLVCTHETVEGKTFERWDFPGGRARPEHQTDLCKRLDALYGAKLRLPRETKCASKPKAKPQPAQQDPADDDIPF